MVIAFLLGACGAGEHAATGTVVRDSAGITIVGGYGRVAVGGNGHGGRGPG